MKFFFPVFFFLFSFFFHSNAQQNYFQQEVNYTINVSLDDKKHELKGEETIEYTNNSPNGLHELYFHLWANAYKDDNTCLANELSRNGIGRLATADDSSRGYINKLNFRVNDKEANWDFLEDTIDVCRIELKPALKPGEKIIISTPFHVKIPSADISRLGHDAQAYYITQWYPKPAVYDRNGWNYFPYLDQGEYYSEFGKFDVFISVPKNYVVGATGNLVDNEKELQWLDSNAKATRVAKIFSGDMNFPKSEEEFKTLHYHEENIHDFAWFADKRYHVLKGEVELPLSKRKVTTWAMFTNLEAEYWMKSIDYINTAAKNYSDWVGEYPYNNVTAVDVLYASGNGMEYPTITAIGAYGSEFDLDVTIFHEVGHNWFYGILGSNERRHPWMDEGMNQFAETRYVYTKFGNETSIEKKKKTDLKNFGIDYSENETNHRLHAYLAYILGARNNTDQQPDLSSEKFSKFNYRCDVYRKTAACFDYLKSYLGDTLFDKCMHTYFDEWKFKHPMPQDVKKVFTEVSGKNLDWLFDNLFFSTKKIDYKISSMHSSGNNFSVTVKNKGKIASPLFLSALKDEKIKTTTRIDGFSGKQTINLSCDDCNTIKIDAEEKMPDLRRKNNTIRTSGLFKKLEPIKIRFAGELENPNRSELFFSPVAGWNQYNKAMAGVALYNIFIPEKRFEYLLMPMYAFNTQTLTGGGRAIYNFYLSSNSISKISLSSGYQTYSYLNEKRTIAEAGYDFNHSFTFQKLSNELTFHFFSRKNNSNEESYFMIRHVMTQTEMRNYFLPANDSLYHLGVADVGRNFFQIKYLLENTVSLSPYSFGMTLTFNKDFILPSITYSQTIPYRTANHGLEVRVFAGFSGETRDTKYETPEKFPVNYRLRMNGQSGGDDYLFDEVFLGRSEGKGILTQQFIANQGGFKVPTYTGQSNTWLVALNLKTTIPGNIPLKLFADIGAYDNKGLPEEFKPIMYDYGISLSIIKNIFEIYFPLGYSDDIKKVYETNPSLFEKYSQKIRYELNLSKLNPFTLLKNYLR